MESHFINRRKQMLFQSSIVSQLLFILTLATIAVCGDAWVELPVPHSLPSFFSLLLPSLPVFLAFSLLPSHSFFPSLCSFSPSFLPSLFPTLSLIFLPSFSTPINCLPIIIRSVQWHPTLCGPMDCSPPHSSAHGIFQARILKWGAISYSMGSSRSNPGIEPASLESPAWAGRFFTTMTTCEAHCN